MECAKGDSPIQLPISGVNFSNMSIPSAKVSMSETEHDTTFKSSYLLTSRINFIPSCLKPFRFIVLRLLENPFVKLTFSLHNAIISVPYRRTLHKFAQKGLSYIKAFFARNVLPYFRGGDCEYILTEYL